jgi:hypothetical protein
MTQPHPSLSPEQAELQVERYWLDGMDLDEARRLVSAPPPERAPDPIEVRLRELRNNLWEVFPLQGRH